MIKYNKTFSAHKSRQMITRVIVIRYIMFSQDYFINGKRNEDTSQEKTKIQSIP